MFQRQEKKRNEILKLSSDGILDFGSFTRGMLADLECPAEIWGVWGRTYLRAGGREQEGEKMEEDRKTTNLPAVRE